MKPSITRNKIKNVGVIIGWIFIWQIIYLKVGKEVLVPSPFHTIQEVMRMAGDLKFYIQIAFTLERVAVGVSLSLILGSVTSLLSYNNKEVEIFLRPAIAFMKSTPIMAIIILAILWFPSHKVPIFVCFLMCYPIVYTNVLAGFKALDTGLIELSKVYKVKPWICMRKCYLPQLKPYLYAALDLTLGMAWKVVIAAEVLSVPPYSVGYALMDAKRYLETKQVFAWLMVIVSLSELCQWGVHSLIKKRGENS